MDVKKKISRRQFLLTSAGIVGGATVLCAGGAGLAMQPVDVDMAESSLGSNAGMGKVLVTYASMAGSTGEIAEAIGKKINESGVGVDVKPVIEVADVSLYRAVVLGSPLIRSAWMEGAISFLEAFHTGLRRIPVAYFLGCATLAALHDAQTLQQVNGYLDPVRQQFPGINVVDTGLFAGRLDFSKLPAMYRIIWPIVTGNQVKEGDYRDWNAINTWAADITPKLIAG